MQLTMLNRQRATALPEKGQLVLKVTFFVKEKSKPSKDPRHSYFVMMKINDCGFRLAKMGRHHRTRPWSAHESRLQADPIFHMRKKHWEGLIAGKKRLHRGQLLPGSTSSTATSEDESKRPPPTCWSECSSPRKQVRIEQPEVVGGAQDVATPLIKAIKEELQKFQRPKSPNLAGISIINDPELLQQDK